MNTNANKKEKKGYLYIIGIGPGKLEHLSQKARLILEDCHTVVGYKSYIKTIESILDMQKIYEFSMHQEEARCRKAIDLATKGQRVALISSGDPGIYGMASPALELLTDARVPPDIGVEVIPGISALNYSASLLGAPLAHDFAVISLSDLLTPWSVIEKRVAAAASADFVQVYYNPKSKKRFFQINDARDICLKWLDKSTAVGIVRQFQNRPIVTLTDLERMCDTEIDMLTTVIIGNSTSYIRDDKMITPRGYVL